MKTHYNDVEYAKKMAQKGLSSFPPAIPFEKPAEKKSSNSEDEKDNLKPLMSKLTKMMTTQKLLSIVLRFSRKERLKPMYNGMKVTKN